MWAENFYSMFPVYGLLPNPEDHPAKISNNYVFGQIHTTMDNSQKIHNAMISAIWQVDDIDRGLREPKTLMAYGHQLETIDQAVVGSVQRVAEGGSLLPAE